MERNLLDAGEPGHNPFAPAMPDFSRLQVGKHDVLVIRGEMSSDTARNFEVLGSIRDALHQHLGFEGVIVQLPHGMDLERLSEEAGRHLYRALAEVYGDTKTKTCPFCRPEVDPSCFEQGAPGVEAH